MNLLAVFAHPDDEIGAAGTLALHARKGDRVMLVWMTRGELASQFGDAPPEEVARVREGHGAHVAGLIGAEPRFLPFRDTLLTGGREEALALARLMAEFRPDAVITWDPLDVHPDHRATHQAVLSALKLCRIPKLVGEAHRKPVRLYHYPRRELLRPWVYVNVAETQEVAEKVFAFYREFYGWAFSLEDFRARRRLLGQEAGVPFAEAFQTEAPPAWPGLP
ncbi:N-acetylglucosaminyl deacetylase, LmbE family [Thermus arciformis]|uniref:N-acetylglucosaminyl deacetylase, LmbE family n=1 Tax=Thermus arciformis TaxID=482827 RepID=A0A1G7EZP0_9DEIN|nr:PIG-L deacetylase family protein [Thermus arciformis]SDE68775.1 N-acetylglucosaminyl deacetylase, LmbE family [Thermus arciformis]